MKKWLKPISQIRQFHKVVSVQLLGEDKSAYLQLKFSLDSIKIPLVWLRDHCRSDKCYNWKTNQRKSQTLDLFKKAQIKNSDSIRLDIDNQILNIKWKDGHQSAFKTQDLLRWAIQPTDSLPVIFWNNSTLRKIPTIPFANFDFSKFCLSFAKYGVVCVDGVDQCPEVTKKLCEDIAPVHNTFFGYFWTFGVDEVEKDKREDTAYGRDAIGLHTDGTYFDQTPGIQVFHCLKPADEGGDTLLVDGFAVAESFKQVFPAYFNILSTTPIEHHYLEGADCDGTFTQPTKKEVIQLFTRSMCHPIIRVHQGRIIQVRFNPYDRAPLPIPADQDITAVVGFYEAYEAFSKFVHRPENVIKTSLQPGTVIFIDNYRVLHARTAFRGSRKLCGCYLSRDNFLAKARTVLPEAFKHI
ncbi:hypothetical protein FO519_001636 [Halicephalobus sp. NKZ332]|nr:hypothetical protein FO519_001636 [Halicephalobus sp. NKZ332]